MNESLRKWTKRTFRKGGRALNHWTYLSAGFLSTPVCWILRDETSWFPSVFLSEYWRLHSHRTTTTTTEKLAADGTKSASLYHSSLSLSPFVVCVFVLGENFMLDTHTTQKSTLIIDMVFMTLSSWIPGEREKKNSWTFDPNARTHTHSCLWWLWGHCYVSSGTGNFEKRQT